MWEPQRHILMFWMFVIQTLYWLWEAYYEIYLRCESWLYQIKSQRELLMIIDFSRDSNIKEAFSPIDDIKCTNTVLVECHC